VLRVLSDRLLDRAIFDPERFVREWMYGFFAADAVRETKAIASRIANSRFIRVSPIASIDSALRQG
jgi:hypothetical protein